MNHKNLRITDGRGFQIVCANGITVSVQFGAGNYCANRSITIDEQIKLEHSPTRRSMECDDAEIAVWFESGEWHDWGGDEVIGHIPADEVARLIGYAQSWQPGTPFAFTFKEPTDA
jgi:hypothetical protein